MGLQDSASRWYIPTQATDAFPIGSTHASTTTLASSDFANTKAGVRLDGFCVLDSAVAGTFAVKDTAGNTLFTNVSVPTTGAPRTHMFGPDGLDMGAGFSINYGGASANLLVWYRTP